ncbi:MAG: hypothetical protein ABIT47_02115 [Candidatus Paceibacterota bacterium]
MTQQSQIAEAHSWVKIHDKGTLLVDYHVHIGDSSIVVDTLYVPFLNTTFILAFESSWGSTGGVRKEAVLYAYDHKSSQKVVSRHTIFDGKNPMSDFYPEKIAVTARFESDVYTYENSPKRVRIPVRKILCVNMVSEQKFTGYAIEGVHRTILRQSDRREGWLGYEDVIVATQKWATGEIGSDSLTKRNICQSFQKFMESVPE